MSKFRFKGEVVVEADSEEDALRQVAQNISTAARHLGDGESINNTGAFFTLAGDARGEPVDVRVDPLAPAPEPSSAEVERAAPAPADDLDDNEGGTE